MNRLVCAFFSILILQTVTVCKAFSMSELQGKVVKVSSGDSITVLSGKKQINIKLGALQTPDPNEKHGKEVKQYVSDLILNKEISVYVYEKDSQGRETGFVYIKNMCLNEELIKKGYAIFRGCEYDTCIKWDNYQKQAKENHLGIWEKKPGSYLETVSADPKPFQADGFSFSLYEGWNQIPDEVIREFEKNVNSVGANLPKQHYDYAFQLESAREWFEYPYVIIQINKEKRIPKKDMEKLEKISSKDFDDFKNPLSSEIKFGKTYFDSHEKIIWMKIEVNDPGLGTISGLSGTIPIQKGFVQISGYAVADQFSYYESAFRSLIRSVSLHPDLIYRSIWTDNLPEFLLLYNWPKVLKNSLTGAGIGLLAAIVSLLVRKRK